MSEPDQIRPEPGPDADIDDLQTDIEQTRKELGETVEALTAKMDVKERTKEKVAQTKERVAEKAHDTKERVAEKAHDTKERVAEKAHDTKELVVEKAHTVQHATLDDGRAKRTIPGAVAIVVGAAVVWFLWRRR
jgi:cell division septum initiation protein DivIVA